MRRGLGCRRARVPSGCRTGIWWCVGVVVCVRETTERKREKRRKSRVLMGEKTRQRPKRYATTCLHEGVDVLDDAEALVPEPQRVRHLQLLEAASASGEGGREG